MGATGLLVWLALPFWYLLIPAMVLHGVTIVTMFAPMHECVHRTAFASPAANDAVGWIAGVHRLLQFDLLSLLPRLASPLHAGSGARSRADVSQRRRAGPPI
jgi:hypothetical protein